MKEQIEEVEEITPEIHQFLVEVIFDEVYVEGNGTSDMQHRSKISSQVFSFSNPDRDEALRTATAELERIQVEGLVLLGGAVIKTIITPASIRQVGLIDYKQYVEEMQAMFEQNSDADVASGVAPDVPALTETAEVNNSVAG